MKIVKRNGKVVRFDKSKIEAAETKAFMEVDRVSELSNNSKLIISSVADSIFNVAKTREILNKSPLTVEECQDLVVAGLTVYRPDVAKAYEDYRSNHNKAREKEDSRHQRLIKNIKNALAANNVINANANVDEYSFSGRMGEAANAAAKDDALNERISAKVVANHITMRIYIHDLDRYSVGMHNCLSIPFDDLLAKGFYTRNMDVRPAGRLSTALQQMAVIFQLQSQQQFGGVSATHIDWTLVPYIRKSFAKHFKAGLHWLEGMSKEAASSYVDFIGEITLDNTALKGSHPAAWAYAMDNLEYEAHQSVEAFYHNLNTLQSRSGGQLPFTSINYGTCTLPEGRFIIKALLDVSIEGLGSKHRTSIFPCSIMQLGKGINLYPGDPNYDLFKLALKSTSQRLYPNYANIDWSGNAGYDKNDPKTFFSTMGCRTANGWDINGFGQLKDGRGNIAPTTIIMPMLAMEAIEEVRDGLIDGEEPREDEVVSIFMRILDEAIHDAKDALIERFEYICSQDPRSADFMWVNKTMAGYVPEEGIRSAMKHGTLAIGQIGLAETLQILIGCDHTTGKGMKLAKKIEQLFKDRCAEFKETEKLNFGVYYTPAENLCYKAMKAFQDKYGIIKDVSDKEFFTNSIHVPVWKNVNPFEKIDIESQLTGYSSAGCITYVEFDAGAKYNLDALEAVVVYAMEKDIPYFAINVPVDTCVECGYTDQIGEACPVCGGTHIQRLRRVTGYINGDYESSFNLGKQQEVAMRYCHSKLLANRVYTKEK